jgi:hypothetical protein
LLIGSDETKNDEIKSPPIWLHQLVLWCLSEAQPNSLYKWSWATNWFCLQPPAPEFVIIIGIDMRKKKWKNVSWQFLPPPPTTNTCRIMSRDRWLYSAVTQVKSIYSQLFGVYTPAKFEPFICQVSYHIQCI